MPKFTVYCTIMEDWQVEVEADSEAEAKIKVETMQITEIQKHQEDDCCVKVHDVVEHKNRSA